MNRVVLVAMLLIILICMAGVGVGALPIFLPQEQTVVQMTSSPVAASPVVTPLLVPTAVIRPATPFHSVTGPAQAGNGISVSRNKFTNSFPQDLLFELDAQSNSKIAQIALFIAFDGQSSSSRQVPDFTLDNRVQASYSWDLGRGYVPPGVSGQYWWTIRDGSGEMLETRKQGFRVDDIAQQWKKISNDQLALYWYSGDNSFGSALFNRGVQTIKFLQQDTGVTVDHQIQIFIYGSRSDFFNALEPGSSEWTGGRAFPEYSCVLIDVTPSNLDWGLSTTTHELTHQVIHQKIQSPLGDSSMPHWMDEGLAVYYETYPGALDPQFAVPLKREIQSDSLQQLRSLSGSFPADSAAANLSYAESYSVVDFIIRHYGREKLAQLLQGFKSGGFYDDIFEQVLGVDTDGLENQWRADVGARPRLVSARAATTPTPFLTFSLSTK